MAEITVSIGGRPHLIGCRNGEEDRVRLLGHMLDDRWPAAYRAAGNQPGERALLFIALMLADALDEAEQRPAGHPEVDDTALARIAERLEALATALEQTPATP